MGRACLGRMEVLQKEGTTMDNRYVVIDMPAPGTDGDIYQEVYTTHVRRR